MINIEFYPPQNTVLTFPIGLTLGALLSAFIVNEITYKRKSKENKIKLYSRLKGEKYLLCQWLESVTSESIYIENNRALVNKINESEFKRDINAIKLIKEIHTSDHILRSRYDAHVIELAKIKEKSAKDLGLTEIYFGDLRIRGLLINAIERAEDAIDKFDDDLEMEIQNDQYEADLSYSPGGVFQFNCIWQTKKLHDQKVLIGKLDYAIENLLIELKSEIEKIRWWRFWK